MHSYTLQIYTQKLYVSRNMYTHTHTDIRYAVIGHVMVSVSYTGLSLYLMA